MDNEKVDGLSMDIEAADREKLQAVFPQCFTDGRLDIDKLLNLCGEYISDDFEKYEFRWKGKAEALQLAGKRSTGTLRPCRADSVDWDTTRNVYIEGDNLEVLKLLQTTYFRKVKMIYIDPPYNTGNDFVYADDFAEPLARYKEVTAQTTKSNPETMGRFHTNWLNMMYPRLRLAANLLRDDGVIFISIDSGEEHNLRKICDETFGEENFVDTISWFKKASPSNDAQYFSNDVEYILVYAKNRQEWKPNRLPLTDKQKKYYQNPDNDPRGSWNSATYTCNKSKDERPNLYYPIQNPFTGEDVWPKETAVWAYSQEQCDEHIKANLLFWGIDGKAAYPRFKKLLEGHQGVVNRTLWHYDDVNHTQGASEELKKFGILGFATPKPTRLINKMLQIATDKDSIILDFFSGSATTAHAVMQLNAEDGGNRRFILVQLPEVCDEKSEAAKAGYTNICEIGKARIRKAKLKLVEDKLNETQIKHSSPSVQYIDTKSHKPKTGEPFRIEDAGENSIRFVGDIPERLAISISATHVSRLQNKQTGEWEILLTDKFGDGHSLYPEKVILEFSEFYEKFDGGFRVFKLDSSNLKLWDSSPIRSYGEDAEEELYQRLIDHLEILKADRTSEDVVFEVMLKLGQDLCETVQPLDINGKTVYGVGVEVKFIVCLADDIQPEDAKAMAEYAPGRIIFADGCFSSTEQKSNVRLTLKDKGITIKTL